MGHTTVPVKQRPILWFVSVLFVCAFICGTEATSSWGQETREYTGVSFGRDGVGGSEEFAGLESIAFDPGSERVYAYDAAAGAIYKFDADGQPVDFAALGSNAIEGVGGFFEPGAGQIAIAPPGAVGGTEGDIYVANGVAVEAYSAAGDPLGSFGEGETCGVAVDPGGAVYVGSFPSVITEYVPGGNPPVDADKSGEGEVAINLCNVAADGAGNVFAANYGGAELARLHGVGDSAPTIVSPAGATMSVDPISNDLEVDRGDSVAVYGSNGDPLYEYGSGQISGSFGIATAGAAGRAYVADGATGTIKVFGPPLTLPSTGQATDIRAQTATLRGAVYPEGNTYSGCAFEYGLASGSGFEHVAECEPPASQIPADSEPHEVSLALVGLVPNSDYKFRLVTTNAGGTGRGETLTFSTVGAPRIGEVFSRAAQESATVEATIDPRGSATSYRIEWGTDGSYGNLAAAGTIGQEAGPTRVIARLEGLIPATAYHYRVAASSVEGGAASTPDQQVETLNACGLTDHRCFELVSRADKGPLASPGMLMVAGQGIQFQAAARGSAFAYTVPYGYRDATAGDAALYLARRGAEGWSSEQLSPPTLEGPLGAGATAVGSKFKVLSSNLDCGVVAGIASLTTDAPSTVVDAGGANLYRRDDVTGSYELITDLPPLGPPTREEIASKGGFLFGEYGVVGMSPDCERVVFRSAYRYPGISAPSGYQLYEWDHGSLHDVAVIPGPGGDAEPVATESIPGGMDEAPGNGVPIGEKAVTDYWHAVSVDGSRSIFTARSRFGPDAGNRAVFLRDGDDPGVLGGAAPATDISQSETATPNDGNSRYWTASASGRRVFFTARYGLATNATSAGLSSCANVPRSESEGAGAGCDLYEYDDAARSGDRLTDLSPDLEDPKGAGVVGVLDASEDGSFVYFAARGRLGGSGRSEAENLGSGTYNIYVGHEGMNRFVGALGEAEAIGASGGRALIGTESGGAWTSRSTTTGSLFVFESSLGVPDGVPMVYLYDAADGSRVCVSCRHDGQQPFSARALVPLSDARESNIEERIVQPTILTDNGRLYFYSFDPLAPGAVEGRRNLFQYEHGQLSLIATEAPGVPQSLGSPNASFFGGASADGDDVYLATPQGLLGVDRDERWDVYDARVGGGFPEPAPAPAPCDAAAEGACDSGGGGGPVATGTPTATFTGPGNPRSGHGACGKGRHTVKKHGKRRCVRRHPRQHRKAHPPGRAGGDRRTSR